MILTLSHPLDYLRWLFGEVDRLWAFSGRMSDLEIQVEDTAEIGLRFIRNVIGSLHLDYNQQPPAHWLEVVGARGTLRWDNANGDVRLYRAASQANESGGEWETIPFGGDGRPFERNELFLAEMRHFIELARAETQPLCSLEDGLRALELALAAQQSADQGSLIKLD